MTDTALERQQPTAPLDPNVIVQQAMAQNMSGEQLNAMLEFAKNLRNEQARVAFDDSLSAVQDAVGWVAKDVERSDGKGKYASFEGLDGALRPEYVKRGFSVSFDADPHPPDGQQIVVAYVSRSGITRTYHLPVLIDPNGPKGNPVMTKTDASTAAHSKGCRILLGRIFNIATGEKETTMTPEEAENLDALVKQMKNSATLADCKEAYGKAYKLARDIGNNEATLQIIDLYEKLRDEFKEK